jgi:hypothetical protein
MRIELFKLVIQFLGGRIDYQAFREAMVTRFLSRRTGDEALDSIAARIDVVCADFSSGLIAADEVGAYIVVAMQADAMGASIGSASNIQVGQPRLPDLPQRAATSESLFLTAVAA